MNAVTCRVSSYVFLVGGEMMQTKLLATLFLAGASLFAGPRVFVGVGVGAPPPPPVVAYAPPCPGPGYPRTHPRTLPKDAAQGRCPFIGRRPLLDSFSAPPEKETSR